VLKALGAGGFQHLNGSLEVHLKGTAELLQQWHSRDVLVYASLFHAAYGTELLELFFRMDNYLSDAAQSAYRASLEEFC
jgi:hypothetical protein